MRNAATGAPRRTPSLDTVAVGLILAGLLLVALDRGIPGVLAPIAHAFAGNPIEFLARRLADLLLVLGVAGFLVARTTRILAGYRHLAVFRGLTGRGAPTATVSDDDGEPPPSLGDLAGRVRSVLGERRLEPRPKRRRATDRAMTAIRSLVVWRRDD